MEQLANKPNPIWTNSTKCNHEFSIPHCTASALYPLIVLALAGCASGLHFKSKDGTGAATAAPPTEMITEALIRAERQQVAGQPEQDLSLLFVTDPAPYTIGRGDILLIVVWDYPELAGAGMSAAAAAADSGAAALNANASTPQGFLVDHEGRIQFPFAGLLPVEVLTEVRARALLTEKLAKYIASPNVTLRVQSFRSKRVYSSMRATPARSRWPRRSSCGPRTSSTWPRRRWRAGTET